MLTTTSDHSAINEGCVEGTGPRTLLRFETATPNRGTADLVLGNPTNDPRFHYDSCHQYELLLPSGLTMLSLSLSL
jgi:hypothetical protein